MKGLRMMRWAGLAAVVGGMFMTLSDLLNLTIHVPGLGESAHTGYQAVGSGVILVALTLLFVGMVGLFATAPRRGGPEMIEYGDACARYVLVETEKPRPTRPEPVHVTRPDAPRPAAWRHRTARSHERGGPGRRPAAYRLAGGQVAAGRRSLVGPS